MVAVPARLKLLNVDDAGREPGIELLMVALPAVLLLKKSVLAPILLLIVALPAEEVWRNSTEPPVSLSIVIVPAVVELRKIVTPPN